MEAVIRIARHIHRPHEDKNIFLVLPLTELFCVQCFTNSKKWKVRTDITEIFFTDRK